MHDISVKVRLLPLGFQQLYEYFFTCIGYVLKGQYVTGFLTLFYQKTPPGPHICKQAKTVLQSFSFLQ